MSTNRVLLALALLLPLASCASTPATAPATGTSERVARPTPPHEIIMRPVGSASSGADGFETRFEFEVRSPLELSRNSLVQELRQEVILERADGTEQRRAFTLVEAFRLQYAWTDAGGLRHYRMNPGVSDRHAMVGFEQLPPEVIGIRLTRTMFIYVANVREADFTDFGFAHLPHNEDRTVVTNAPRKFNARYQARHETRGRVMHSGDALGLEYTIHYTDKRNDGRDPSFRVELGSR